MSPIPLTVVPDPARLRKPRVVIPSLMPVIRGHATKTCVGGSCGFVLAERIELAQIVPFIFRCPRCHFFNHLDEA